jgi:hypothetical protein
MRTKPQPNTPDLPERLHYLQPFRRKFASRSPEELNEDSGAPPLMALLTKRIRGLSVTEAAQVLEEDRTALEQWLSSLGEKGDPLHFVLGFFLTASPEELAALIKEEAEKPPEPKLCLHMELPPGARLKRVARASESTRIVTFKGVWLGMDALPKEAVDNLFDATLGPACGWLDSSIPEVRFGPVTGRKLVAKGEGSQGPMKQIYYALSVPGGHVFGSICPIGKKVDQLQWDESPFEAVFHTLRVETKPPSTLNPSTIN